MQNDFLKKFVVKNDIDEHMKIHIIKPLWNKQTVFQAVASVSSVLRDGFRNNKDKVVVGLTSELGRELGRGVNVPELVNAAQKLLKAEET